MINKPIQLISLLALLIFLAVPASAADTSVSSAAQISVISYESNPSVLMKGDIATVKVIVKNTGTENVDIKRATILTKDLNILNEQSYATVGAIGPDVSKEFVFTLKAKSDGIFYPRFYLDFSNGGSLGYPLMTKVESSPIELSVLEKPDVFQKDVKSNVKLVVGNPRENTVNGVIIKPVSDSASFTQTSIFVGKLDPNENREIEIETIPSKDGEIKFIAEYRNGINIHETEKTIPLILGEDKKSADPVVNNIEIQTTGKGYRVSGDVTNAGLKNAKSVVVTTKSPAVPIEPNRLYVIGELEPDDFSGFDVDFIVEEQDFAPLLIQYKDEDGNDYTKTIDIKLKDSSLSLKGQDKSENSDEGLPLVAIILIIAIIVVICGAIYYSWKK
ncbi:hypothetical protein L1994_09385 [Methanomicrobium antiquum]|uniref:CARDB domain-containing protein n=1 Tax=Methanomicrobium antiquum TaxID=487686 RepID=A0AAF0FQW7_9EURY|nr:hypothetical protein [Methanomicrobium antiquum]WFN36346.1 hypothetical protein L1994_09385 [Methanomicrobium antiquum]